MMSRLMLAAAVLSLVLLAGCAAADKPSSKAPAAMEKLPASPGTEGFGAKTIADMVVAQDGSGDYTKVQDAIDAAPRNQSTRTVIFIKPGTYKEKIQVPSDRKNLTLMGESYENTILTYDDHARKTKDYASTRIYADDFCAANVTFQNTIDSRKGGGQAAALRVDGDRAVFYKCKIMGFQDTYYTGGNKRSYHKDCIIEGTTDFIYGDGIALFEDCTIINRKDSHITAHCQKLKDGRPVNTFGYVFKNCDIKAHPGEEVSSADLGRPWGNAARVVYLNCSLGSHINPEGWSIWKGRNNHPTAYYAEYKNSGPGYQPQSRPDWTHQLTDEQAAAYTKENIFKANTTTAVKLDGDWNPVIEDIMGAKNAKPAVKAMPAFPGAEGFGKYTMGGRGGNVYEVTNLNDSGPGSLRDALALEGPRTIVFRVSGNIALKSRLRVPSNTTIAGQTAPGDGICLTGQCLQIAGDQIIIRYIRSRLGDQSGKDDDAVNGGGTNIILDHVSASWSLDETLSIYGTNATTIQWCMITESLSNSHHAKGAHGYGGIWGGENHTHHHNLLAHHSSRNPRFSGNADYRNNVIYNWGHNSAYGGSGKQINMVANYYKAGPATEGKVQFRIAEPYGGEWFVKDNYVDGSPAITADNWDGGVQGGKGTKVNEPFAYEPIHQQTALEAYDSVLNSVGCSFPKRDAIDARIIQEVRDGKATYGNNGIIDSQNDVGGWPELKSLPAPEDSDHDGMPDEWEKKNGLNPHDASDGPLDRNGDGYTNVEEYINGLVL